MPRMTDEALAAIRVLAQSLLAEALGLSPTDRPPALPVLANDSRQRWTRDTILQTVERFLDHAQRLPSYDEWMHAGRWGLPAVDTLRRHWGSRAALHEAVHLRQRLRQALTHTEEDTTCPTPHSTAGSGASSSR